MPSHAAKKFPGLNAREVLAQSAGMDIPRLSPKSINDRLTTVKAFLSWAADAELVAEGLGRVLKPLPDEAGRHKRKPLDAAEVRAFLALCKADGTTAAQRLIPAICAYSGARLNEIAQLDRDDIQRVDGIWIFKIQGGEGKALKTANAARTVPIHSSLVDAVLGQLKTVPKGNLWGLEIGHNRHSGALSKWLARKLDAVTDDRKKVVHSLRHSVATQLKGRGFAEYLIESLLGHASKSMSTGRYGHEVPVAKLAELVESIAYEP
jgi:integrase